jgi:RND family efflux transporter MFP subunit
MRRKQIVWIGIGAIAVILVWRIIVLIVASQGGSSGGFGRPPVAVELDQVSYEPISESRVLTGSIHPLYQYIVAPKVSGRIIRITKRIGDWVERGEFIARVDDGEYQQQVLESEASLRIAYANLAETESELDLAEQELERIQLLSEKKIASDAQLETAETRYEALNSRMELARAQVEQRQASVNTARIRLGYTRLLATEPGFVGERYVDEGSMLAPNSPVVSVIGIDTVIVRTTVIERVYGLVAPGQSATVEVDAFPGRTFRGRVSRIAPMLDEASRVAKMEVEVANDSLFLKPGMFCKVTLILAEKDSAQVVPSKAVVTRNGASGVFVVRGEETTAHYVPVEVGIVNPGKTEILSPAIDGAVVTLGQHLLQEGSTVILPGRNEGGDEGRSGGGDSRAAGPGATGG